MLAGITSHSILFDDHIASERHRFRKLIAFLRVLPNEALRNRQRIGIRYSAY